MIEQEPMGVVQDLCLEKTESIYSGQASPVSQTRGQRLQSGGLQHGGCSLYPLPLGLVSVVSAWALTSLPLRVGFPGALSAEKAKEYISP